jgi:hypothetical protein
MTGKPPADKVSPLFFWEHGKHESGVASQAKVAGGYVAERSD